MNLNKILNQIDVVELGEILMNKAESILYSDYNIIVLKIEYEDLLKSLIEEYPLLSKLHQKLNIL